MEAGGFLSDPKINTSVSISINVLLGAISSLVQTFKYNKKIKNELSFHRNYMALIPHCKDHPFNIEL